MKTVHCEMCSSREVCFVQKQIKSLAERMTQSPFIVDFDTKATRTAETFQRHEKMMCKRYDLERELKRIIALRCSLYVEKVK